MAEATGFWFDEFATLPQNDLVVAHEWIDKHGLKRTTRVATLVEVLEFMKIQEALDADMETYGGCYWKIVNGKRVRIPPREVYHQQGAYFEETTNLLVQHKVRR